MTDRKISELTNITGADLADNDEFVVVDTSADETKAITYGELKNFNGTLTSDGLTVDGAASITTGDNTAQLTLISTDADANDGPLLVLNRNSSSPADNDKVGQIQFLGEDDASNSTIFGSIVNQIKDASNGSEDGRMSFNLISAGSDRTFFNLTHDGTQAEVVVNEDSIDMDFRVESDASANALFVEGSSGNVGIGTSSPASIIHSLHPTSPKLTLERDSTSLADNNVIGEIAMAHKDSNDAGTAVRIIGRAEGTAGAVGLAFNTGTPTSIAERMRIDSSGNIFFGATSGSAPSYYFAPDSGGGSFKSIKNSTDARTAFEFHNPNGTIGSITTSGSATAYNTSSDYRLKTNAQPMTGASDRVLALNPVNFEWIADGTRVDGFLAHEAQAVVPECVTGTKDAMRDEEYQVSAATGDIYTAGVEAGFNEVSAAIEASPAYYDVDGNIIKAEVIAQAAVHEAYDAVEEVIHSTNVEQPETLEDGQQWRETTPAVMGTRSVPDMQGIDQSKLVPLLVASLQEALARITALENA